MTDYKTLRVPVDAWEAAKEQKETSGRTWGEQIVRPDGEADPPVSEGIENLLTADKADIERLKELVEHVPERTADELEGRFR